MIATTAQSAGGVWRHLEDLAVGLKAKGVEPVLALPSHGATLQERAESAGLRWLSIREALGRPADLWHLHLHNTFDVRAVGLSYLLALPRRPPLVMTEHLPRAPVSDPRQPYSAEPPPGFRKPGARHAKTLIKRLQIGAATRVICVSNSSVNFMVQRYGLSRSRFQVVHNGIAPLAAAPPPAAGVLQVVSIGAVGWRKGHDVLIAAAGLAERPWTVAIVGDGAERAELELLAARTAPNRVTFTGWLDEPGSYVASAHVSCLASRWEAFPYAALEAMASGRPLVASAVDGLPEAVVHGVNGLLVPPGDAPALAAALDRLSDDPTLVARLGTAARSTVIHRFRLDQMIDATMRIYDGALSNP